MADHDVGATKNGGDGPPQPANTAALPTSTSTSSSAMSMSMPAVSKVKLSLGNTKKKKKKSKSSSTTCAATRDTFASSTAALAAASEDGNKTIADLAEENVRKRAERNEGKLVIPLVGGRDGNRPLLANRKGHGRDAAEEGSTTNHVKQQEDDNGESVPIKAPPAETAVKSEGDRRQPQPDRVKSEAEQDEDDNDDDAAAMAALVQSAADRTSSSRRAGDTNFAASGNLIIKQEELRTKLERDAAADNAEDEEYVDEEEEFKRDLAKQADDVDVESEVYAAVPISEFGAAMLRGMGWTGGDDESNGNKKKGDNGNEDDDMADMRPRHHRLGLGAAPRPVSMSAKGSSGATKPGGRHRALRPHELERAEREKRDEELWKKKAEERTRLDKQKTAQVGSVVRIRGADDVVGQQRAILVKTTGVPGLNQVLIRYENTADDASVRKSDIVLISQAELDERPFVEMKRSSSSSGDKKNTKKNRDEEEKKESRGRSDAKDMRSRDRDESSRSRKRDRSNERYRHDEDRRDRDRRSDRNRRDDRRDRDRDRRRDDGDKERKRSSSDRKESDRRRSKDGDRDRRRKERDDDYESTRDRKRSKKDSRSERRSSDTRPSRSEPEQQQPAVRWLTPNIRVRVVTKKMAKGRQYKEKGIVLDVLPGGSHATIQMADGEVLDRVPDRYLETALPKVGGNVIVLAGDRQYQHAKGRLLERDSDKGRGVVQLFEDMNVLTLSLDDIAEWCGPLDEDMMG